MVIFSVQYCSTTTTSESMGAKANDVPGSGTSKRSNPSNDRGHGKQKDTKQLRYTIFDVIGSVMIFVTFILSDLRNN